MITVCGIFVLTYLFIYMPIIPPVCSQLRLNPMPYLLALATSSNIGSVRQARKQVEIGFFEYLRVGALIPAITIAVGIAVLAAETKIAQGAELPARTARETLSVISRDPSAPVRIFRIALRRETPRERTIGLQGFRGLGPDEAALFSFDPPEHATFWMAGVAFPIDILFVDERGRIVKAQRDCRPGSREIWPSGAPVRWVIETAAGSGLQAGDRVVIGQGP